MFFRKFLFLAIVTLNSCCAMELAIQKKMSLSMPHIIFLNGTTTAGKSSIACELEKTLKEQSVPVEILAGDDFLLPKVVKRLAWNRATSLTTANINLISPEEMKEIIRESQDELCAAVRIAYEQNKTVIIDTPAYNLEMINFYKQAFADLKNVKNVLVFLEFEELVKRVGNRNATLGMLEQRSVFQAMHQFGQLYGSENIYLVNNVLKRTALNEACAQAKEQHKIMQEKIFDFSKSVQNAICPWSGDTIQAAIIKKFKLDQYQVAQVATETEYDCIVNTGELSSEECAKEILRVLYK